METNLERLRGITNVETIQALQRLYIELEKGEEELERFYRKREGEEGLDNEY